MRRWVLFVLSSVPALAFAEGGIRSSISPNVLLRTTNVWTADQNGRFLNADNEGTFLMHVATINCVGSGIDCINQGSGLMEINATGGGGGGLPLPAGDTTYAMLHGTQTFTGNNAFWNPTTFYNTVTIGTYPTTAALTVSTPNGSAAFSVEEGSMVFKGARGGGFIVKDSTFIAERSSIFANPGFTTGFPQAYGFRGSPGVGMNSAGGTGATIDFNTGGVFPLILSNNFIQASEYRSKASVGTRTQPNLSYGNDQDVGFYFTGGFDSGELFYTQDSVNIMRIDTVGRMAFGKPVARGSIHFSTITRNDPIVTVSSDTTLLEITRSSFTIATSTFVLAGSTNPGTFYIHVESTGAAPTLGSGAGDCGTNPTIVGNDLVGRITVGSGANGGVCTMTFVSPWSNAPVCTINDETTAILIRPASPTTTTVAFTGVIVAGDSLSYSCMGFR